MRTAILIVGSIAMIILGIDGIVKRRLVFGIFPPLDTKEHKGAGAIILGVLLILGGLGMIIYEIYTLMTD